MPATAPSSMLIQRVSCARFLRCGAASGGDAGGRAVLCRFRPGRQCLGDIWSITASIAWIAMGLRSVWSCFDSNRFDQAYPTVGHAADPCRKGSPTHLVSLDTVFTSMWLDAGVPPGVTNDHSVLTISKCAPPLRSQVLRAEHFGRLTLTRWVGTLGSDPGLSGLLSSDDPGGPDR